MTNRFLGQSHASQRDPAEGFQQLLRRWSGRLPLGIPRVQPTQALPGFLQLLAHDVLNQRQQPQRQRFVERIYRLYPEAEVIECLDTPHNRIELDESDAMGLHRLGKQTLVFGELKTAVRFSQEKGNACPNYWHFSPYGFCPYGCEYCYLAGTQGVKFSPTVKIYVNLPEILGKIDRIARRKGRTTAFYLGKLQDALALDPLTAYSTVLVPFLPSIP